MSIHLNKPYKVASSKQKRYEAHYQIPAADALVVPLKEMGEEVSCEIRWEDSNGELQVIQNAMFVKNNLTPLNGLLDVKLFEIWTHYYNPLIKNHEQ
jgi:hypothetical protein